MTTQGFVDELKTLIDHEAIGSKENELLKDLLARVNKNTSYPLRLFANHPTPGATLNISGNKIESGDGSEKTTPPIEDTIQEYAGATINFQTGIVAPVGEVTTSGGTFTLPTVSGSGKFVRCVFKYVADANKVDSFFGAEQASAGALEDAGALYSNIDGVPIGFIDLESTSTTAYKTIGSATAIIENKVGSDSRIHRHSGGSGVGGGEDTSFKLQGISDQTAIVKKGKYWLPDNRILISGNVTTDVPVNVEVDLTNLIATPADATLYWLCVDITKIGAESVLSDNGLKVHTIYQEDQFVLLDKDIDEINKQRYIPLGSILTVGTTWAGGIYKTAPTKKHDYLSSYFSYLEEKLDSHSSASTKTTTYTFNAIPQLIFLTFWTESGDITTPLPASSFVTDITSSAIDFDFSGLTFTGNDRVDIALYFVPKISNAVVDMSRSYKSDWISTTPASLTHDLDDKMDIVGLVLQEWDLTVGTSGRIKNLDPREVVVDWDDDNIYLDWTGKTPSVTLQYRIVSGPTALPFAKPINDGNIFLFDGSGQLTATDTDKPCTKIYYDYPANIRAVQKLTGKGWTNVDTIGSLVWVTDDSNHYLQGNIDGLTPSASEPVRIIVE